MERSSAGLKFYRTNIGKATTESWIVLDTQIAGRLLRSRLRSPILRQSLSRISVDGLVVCTFGLQALARTLHATLLRRKKDGGNGDDSGSMIKRLREIWHKQWTGPERRECRLLRLLSGISLFSSGVAGAPRVQ